jgi:D-alanine transaminase
VNGKYVPYAEAAVHVEDRGYQFSDGIYEVFGVRDGRFLDEDGHMARLDRSLGEIKMAPPMSHAALRMVMRETVRRNRVRNGHVYVQITRGVARRDHPFPAGDVPPSLVVIAAPVDLRKGDTKAEAGMSVITLPDIRWKRCDIKSVSLLPNVLAIQTAREAGADDAWLVDGHGFVTEGTRANAWIVDGEGHLITRHLDSAILPGITRRVVMKVAAERGLTVTERAFSVDEAKTAREAFITSAGTTVMPVVEIDGQAVGNGHPGSIATALREAYETSARADARP